MESRNVPYLKDDRYLVSRDGRVFTIEPASRPGRPARIDYKRDMTRLQAEDASRRFLGGRRHGSHPDLVAAPGCTPAGEEPMVWCCIHAPSESFAWGGPYILASGDTARGWYKLALAWGGTAIIHGPSIAAELFKMPTKGP